MRVPMRTYPDGIGPTDSHILWGGLVSDDEEYLIMKVTSNNGRHAAAIRLNRVAVADLIADLAAALR